MGEGAGVLLLEELDHAKVELGSYCQIHRIISLLVFFFLLQLSC